MTLCFEIYHDRNGKPRWRLKAEIGEIIAQGLAYKGQPNIRKGITAVIRCAAKAEIVVVD